MISVRGVHFYPFQIEELIGQVEGAHPRYQLIVRREGGTDILEVLVEVSEQIFFDEMRRQRELVDSLRMKIQEELDLTAKVRLVEPRSLEGDEVPTVVDERKK
jgi:phenylacetate-CoA ligase